MLASRFSFAVLSLAAVPGMSAAYAAAPQIVSVAIADAGDSTLNITIRGSGFGSSTAIGSIDIHPNLRSSLPKNVVKWSDGLVKLSGVPVSVDTSLSIEIYNSLTNSETFWGGSYQKFIKIQSVAFTGSGGSLGMTITGSGFGAAPPGVPGCTDTPRLNFWDFSRAPGRLGIWSAGYTGYGDLVGLNYVSWSNTQIVIAGFCGQYGQKGWVVASGDPYLISIWQGVGGGSESPSTSAGGMLP